MDIVVGVRLGLRGQEADMIHGGGRPCRHGSAASSGDDLVAVETETAKIADGAGIAAGVTALRVLRSQRLGGVLDHLKAIGLGNIHDGLHVGHVAEHVNHHDGLHRGAVVGQGDPVPCTGLLTEGFQLLGIHAEAVIAVDEHWRGELVLHRIHRGDEGQGRNEYHVAGLYSGLHKGEMEGGGSALAGRRVFNAQKSGHCPLQLCDVCAAGGDPSLIQCVIYIFFFIPLKIGDRQRNKPIHALPFPV